jgi:hypothetical protein
MPVKLDDRNPMSNADVLLTIEGLEGYWTEFSGVKKKYSRPKYSDGLSATKRTAASGSGEYENVTIAKPFDPEKDAPILDWIKTKECGETFDFTLRPVKRCNGMEFRGNRAWSLSGCRIEEWSNLEDLDTGSGEEVAMISIVFSVENAVYSGTKAGSPTF